MSSPRKSRWEIIIPVSIILIGLFFFTLGLAGVISINDLVQDRPESSTGRIIACKTETQSISSGQVMTYCLPIVHFITISGKNVEFVAKNDSAGFHKGDYVQIRYNVANPKDAIIPSDMWNFALFLLCTGLFITVMGLVGFLHKKTR
jgi:uncharacterized protein DUF3592